MEYETNANACCEWCVIFFSKFSSRIANEYPEIYNGGSSEGSANTEYFEKWGWYVTIAELAKMNILKMNKVLKINVHEAHVFLAHKIDRKKYKGKIRKPGTTTEL